MKPTPRIGGFVAPGFEEVRAEFERNFAERGEIGAAVAAYWRGEKVVDLWGGRRTPERRRSRGTRTRWSWSCRRTKGLAAMTLAVANARGWLDYDAPVARYWPEFAQNGKAGSPCASSSATRRGSSLLDEKLTIERLRDLDDVARLLARQKPAWPPGTRHGYHAMSIGLYMQELIRHVDPAHRTLGRFFHEEIARPLGSSSTSGFRPTIPDERLATVKTLSPCACASSALRKTPPAIIRKVLWPWSLILRSFAAPRTSTGTTGACLEIGAAGRQRRRHGARDRASLFGVRRGRRRARNHAGDARPHHGTARHGGRPGRGPRRAELLLARLPAARPGRRPSARARARSVLPGPAARSRSPIPTPTSATPT